MIFERKKYLGELIAGRGNGLVKIITGVKNSQYLSICTRSNHKKRHYKTIH